MNEIKYSTAMLAQRPISQIFTGVLSGTCPALSLATKITSDLVPNFPIGVIDSDNVFYVGDETLTAMKGYSINQPAVQPGVANMDTAVFHDQKVASNNVPDFIQRGQVGHMALFSDEVTVKSVDQNFFSAISTGEITDLSSFQTSFMNFYKGNNYSLVGSSIVNLCSSIGARICNYVRSELAAHSNIVCDLSEMKQADVDAQTLIQAVQFTVNAMTSMHGVDSRRPSLVVSAPPYVQTILTATNSLQWLSDRGQPIVEEYKPTVSRFLNPMALYNDGTMIYPDTNFIKHEAGTASTLTDLTISSNPFGAAAADWNKMSRRAKPVNSIDLESAATAVFTLKKGDVIRIGAASSSSSNYLTLQERTTALLNSSTTLRESDAPLTLIVQEDVSATAKTVTVKVNDIYHGYNVDASKFAPSTDVKVSGDHTKLFISQKDRIFKGMCYKAINDSAGSFINIYDLFSAQDSYGGTMAGNAVLRSQLQDSDVGVRDWVHRMTLRTYATFFVMDNFNAQILLPPGATSIDSFTQTLKVKTV